MNYAKTKSEVKSELNRLNENLRTNLRFLATNEGRDDIRQEYIESQHRQIRENQAKMRVLGWAFFMGEEVERKISNAFDTFRPLAPSKVFNHIEVR
jgi:5,10-methylene-tetrahydrofolate dehydrogenase/methenyl tetrahydrofolate cyclohydrolase